MWYCAIQKTDHVRGTAEGTIKPKDVEEKPKDVVKETKTKTTVKRWFKSLEEANQFLINSAPPSEKTVKYLKDWYILKTMNNI